jgi:hypothetical protein
LATGAHEGFIRLIAATTGAETRIPYWYAVASDQPANITVLETTASGRRGATARDAILFRITDAAGLPLANARPEVAVISGGGVVESVVPHDDEVPGLYGLNVQLGPVAGANIFRIQAGAAAVEATITGR